MTTLHAVPKRPAIEVEQLPFVGWRPNRTPCFWALPATGGYVGGCQSGGAAFKAFLKFLKGREPDGGTLPSIVLDMAARLAQAGSDDEREAIRGQIVGFCLQIEGLAREALALGRDCLDAFSL